MASGGARSRSGPAPDPTSKRSDARGLAADMRVLPAEPYKGRPPAWPLPTGTPRERALWKKVWKYPQAYAWKDEPWRHLTIAHYIRWTVKSEDPKASPSTMTQVIRLADSIGLSPAGLRENGWVIKAYPEMEEPAKSEDRPAPTVTSRRLRAVENG